MARKPLPANRIEITPTGLQTFASCSNLFHYNEIHPLQEPINQENQLIRDTIKKIFGLSLQKQRHLQWKEIIAVVDKLNSPEPGLTNLTNLLDRIYKIVREIYKPDIIGYPNLPVSLELYGTCPVSILSCNLELFLISSETSGQIITFSDQPVLSGELFDKIYYRAQVYLTKSALGLDFTPDLLNLSVSGSFKPTLLRLSEKDLETTREVIEYIAMGISKAIHFPSISPQCNSCRFNKICSFE
jgi:CRISPR/Cas system-associated exonuclease Cas4 (RecB family)